MLETHGIINGIPASGMKYDPVVTILWKNSMICSGTLISDRFVLTAAHCVYLRGCRYNALGQPIGCQLETDPSGFKIYLGERTWSGARQIRAAEEIFGYPAYDDKIYSGDIALIKIDAPFENVTPIPALPDDPELRWSESDVGKTVTYVGFGRDEYGQVGRRLMLDASVDNICLGDSTCGVASPGTVCHFRENDGVTCSGDSGGPLLLRRGEILYVAGVTSYGDDGCTSFGCSTAVSSYAAWLAECMGGDGIQNGGDCIQGSQCISGICSIGVCCDQECSESPCQACSAFRGRPQNAHGSCGNASASCDDGDLCTIEDSCEEGACMPGKPRECPAGDQCSMASVCDAATGSCGPRQPLPAGTPCDDGNACTLDDQCFGGGCISSGNVVCPDLPCKQKYGAGCMPDTGECMYTNLQDGTECIDASGNRGACSSGVCGGSSSTGCGISQDINDSEQGANLGALFLMALFLSVTAGSRRRNDE